MPAMQVTATQGGTTANGMVLRVKVLTGAAASPVGNSGTFSSGILGPAQVTVTTTAAGSMVYGALMAFPNTTLTAHAGTTLLDSHNDTVNANFYATFQTTAVTGTPGATIVGTDSPSASGGYSCAAQEILSAGTIQDDPSAPPAAITDSAITVTSDAFTPPDGALMLALVGSDGNTGTTTMTVAGGGVVWTELVKGQSVDGGYGGVWAAVAGTTAPSDPTITITETGSTSQGITARIKVLTGAAPSALQTGNIATQSAAAAHQAAVTTTQTGSIVYGAVIDGLNTSFTAAASTTLFDNVADAGNGIRYGTLRTTAPTGTPGAVTAGASAPADVGSCALAEILPAAPGGTINEDVSSPAVVTVLNSITCQVTVVPPPGSLLVLMIASDGSTGITGMTVTGGGLNWRALAEGHATGQQYAGVWIADVPSGAGAPSVTRLAPWWHPGRGLPGLPGQIPFDAWPPPGQAAVTAGPVTVDSTGSSPAGAGSVTAVVTQIAVATSAGAGSVTAAAAVIAGAPAAGAGAVTAVATEIAGASSAGAGAVAGVATQIATAAPAGAGSVTAAGSVSGPLTASAAGAGSVTAVVTQIAPAAAAGAGAVTAAATQAAKAAIAGAGSAGPAPATQAAIASATGTGAVTDVATQVVIATAAGAGSVTAAGSVTGSGATAAAAGAGAVTAAATQIATAAGAGAGSVADVATQVAKATAAGAGSVTAAGQITGTANVAGAGAVTAKAAQAAPAAAAGAAVLSALATQRAAAAITAAGSVAAAAASTAPITYGTARQGVMTIPAAVAGDSSPAAARAQSGQMPLPHAEGGQP